MLLQLTTLLPLALLTNKVFATPYGGPRFQHHNHNLTERGAKPLDVENLVTPGPGKNTIADALPVLPIVGDAVPALPAVGDALGVATSVLPTVGNVVSALPAIGDTLGVATSGTQEIVDDLSLGVGQPSIPVISSPVLPSIVPSVAAVADTVTPPFRNRTIAEREAKSPTLPVISIPAISIPTIAIPTIAPAGTAGCPASSNSQSNQCSSGVPYCCSPDGDGG